MEAATKTQEGVPSTAPIRALSPPNRLGRPWSNWLKLLFGLPSQRRLARGALFLPRIRHWEKEFDSLSDEEVRKKGLQLRGRARGGESLDRLLPESFGLTCVAAKRTVGLRPFDVQLAAGVVLHHGALAELATGEGKTLVATAPVVLNALVGKGVHVTTVNDYLAQRDGDWTASIYQALGLTVGVLQQKMPDDARAAAYQADITYGTASEFGFDFLRDRLKQKNQRTGGTPFWAAWSPGTQFKERQDSRVQRDHHYALVDEADNIFIDEARTPLIISMPTRLATEAEQVVYRWADKLAQMMNRDEHFWLDEKKQKVELTDLGRQLVRYSSPPSAQHAVDKLHEHMERSIQAHHRFRRDQHYMVEEDKVVIIDEFTGRRMPDRHWREGLHQAVEAKEGVPITFAADHAAQVTYQSFFRLYTKLSGMTGTAAQNSGELRRVYKLRVVCVPTNRPCIRNTLPDRVFPTESAKFAAIVEEIGRLRALGRPILIGTRSVEKSEALGRRLAAAGIEHTILNARPDLHTREAEIVAQAGRPGQVTIATNMAGRGTDILLGGNAETLAWLRLRDQYPNRHEIPRDIWHQTVAAIEEEENIVELRRQVSESGGLHVLGTERHEARRVDRQMEGRAARQGDPGSAQFFLSLEDELLEGLGAVKQQKLIEKGRRSPDKTNWQAYHPLFLTAQVRLENRHYRQRVDLMVYERNRQEILKDLGADPYVD